MFKVPLFHKGAFHFGGFYIMSFLMIFMVFLLSFSDAWSNKADSLNKIGEYYHFGNKGVSVDYKKSREYYLKAVELGSAVAANHLAGLYANGYGVEKNFETAKKWRLKSSQLDSSLENKCLNASFPPSSLCALVLSATSWERGADSYYLGVFYEHGIEGVKKDLEKAKMYYKRAASYGFEMAVK